MRLLLDTHIFLWSLLDPASLAPQVAEALEDSSNELWLSPLSVWEGLDGDFLSSVSHNPR